MTDTPKHVQDIQLKLWLAKSPGERLFQFLTDNDALYKAILKTKLEMEKNKHEPFCNKIAEAEAPQRF
jgi:hypothetical protein